MFPIRDHNPSGRTPYVTYALVAINILVFISYWPLFDDPRALNAFFRSWAMHPVEISNGREYHSLVTSMFLHGGWMHLAGNMLFLYIFGDNLEDEMGHLGYLGFYLAAGVAASLSEVVMAPLSGIPTVGASGAIAGVMGGYLLLFPKAKVDILIIIVFIFRILPIPAWMVLSAWLTMQIFGGFGATPGEGGVAYWAHAGGFVAGIILTLPVFFRLGGPRFWARTHGQPPHAEARYQLVRSRIPKVRRK
nr:rhomboid family intramembrane serine protease [uncultured Roseovarius sp.]